MANIKYNGMLRYGLMKWYTAPMVLFLAMFVWQSADSRLQLDEPGYLYGGVYQSFEQIIAGDVQPAGEANYSIGRIMHTLLIHALSEILNSSKAVFYALVAIHLFLIFTILFLLFRILRILMPEVNEAFAATMLVAMTPIVIYLAFKTTPDTTALAAATMATYGLLSLARGDGKKWLAITAGALAVTALTKAQAVFLPAGFWAAACLIPVSPIERRRLFIWGSISGIAGMLITVLLLKVLSVDIYRFWDSYISATYSDIPLRVKILYLITELGILWPLLIISFLSLRKRKLMLFWLWLILSMLPLLVLIRNLEPRHTAVNLVAVGSLFALMVEVVNQRFSFWQRLSTRAKTAAASFGVIVIMLSNYLIISIMPHDIEIRQIDKMLQALDHRYGAGKYSIFTPHGYTTFHILRVLWPEVDAYNINVRKFAVNEKRFDRKLALEAYHHGRYYDNLVELDRNDRPMVLMGYINTFGAENMRDMLQWISPSLAEFLMGNLELSEKFFRAEISWLWASPNVTLEPVERVGHYVAFELKVVSLDAGDFKSNVSSNGS